MVEDVVYRYQFKVLSVKSQVLYADAIRCSDLYGDNIFSEGAWVVDDGVSLSESLRLCPWCPLGPSAQHQGSERAKRRAETVCTVQKENS